MKKYLISIAMVLFLLTSLGSRIAFTEEVDVTITNLTSNQPFSPPVLVSHNDEFALFTAGTKASAGLELMAEDGDPSGILSEIEGNANVNQVIAASGPIPPGGSLTISIDVDRKVRYISVAGMLVNTNDSFFGINGIKVLHKTSRTAFAPAFESGTEENNEDCAFVPGPFCEGASTTGGAEEDGVIIINNGIHGVGDLIPALHDWRNPVALITITRK